jgi:glutamate N-acetyltransferase/amino-acid N-acetyltransferase
VDGCTSTNDTVLVLANGASGYQPDRRELAGALIEACGSLAMQMVRDAEGHTKVVTIVIEEAASTEEAERAARKLAGSLLVKSSFYGSDPYWGRVLSELGVAGVTMDVDNVTIAYDDIVVSKGRGPTGNDEAAVPVAKQPEFTLTCRLGAGEHSYFVHTNDLSHAYIDENMGTS